MAQNFLSNALPAAPLSGDNNGLPYTSIPTNVDAQIHRNIISWFVPQFGVVRMYINPQNISYVDKKLITKDKTKGGFTLQYWGEDLTVISLTGTTGSSGIEGINALYEMYRAEQYAFDAVSLTLAANNATAAFANNLSQNIGGDAGLAVNSALNPFTARNIPSLAQLAFGVEMYYNGLVYRGYFEHMTVTERADNFLLEYNMSFVATQRRGYRTNYFPWNRSALYGSSQYNTPNSFSGNLIQGQ
jgi:hypothetical protein